MDRFHVSTMAGKPRTFIDHASFRHWNEAMASKFDPDSFYDCSPFLVRRFEASRLKTIARLLGARQGERVLDIGCGTGRFAEYASIPWMVGVDISDYLLAKARRRMPFLIKAQAEQLPFKDGLFDRAICSEVLEHTPDPRALLEESWRVLREGGILIVTVPNENNINFAKMFARFFYRASLDHDAAAYRIPEKMEEEWHLHCFSIKAFKEYNAGLFHIEKVVALPNRFFPLRYCIRCRKPSKSGDYETELFDSLSDLRHNNFFYRGRAKIVSALLKTGRFCPRPHPGMIVADIGYGHGNKFLRDLFTGCTMVGIDINSHSLNRIAHSNTRGLLVNADVRHLSFKGCFDMVLAFDLLEHVDDDIAAFKNIFDACKAGGTMVITVPALPMMYCSFDRLAFHKRRYRRAELLRKIQEQGFAVTKVSFFITFLLPVVFLFRAVRELMIKTRILRMVEISSAMEVRTVPLLNSLFFWTLWLESRLILRINLLFGASIVVIARKVE